MTPFLSPYRLLFDQVLTRVDAETAHRAGFAAIRAAAPVLGRRPVPAPVVRRMGLAFPGVLGLAAGFDKNAEGIDALAGLGFGFVEIGTVTALAQPGNPRPRLFRLPADRAVVNRMGFNNDGAAAVAARLGHRAVQRERARERVMRADRNHRPQPPPIVGINIGKSKVVTEDEAVEDYRQSARLLAPFADYLVVNVSSPNTPGLRDLQAVEKLQPILAAVRGEIGALPLLVKVAPDLSDDDVLAVGDLALAEGLDGVVATNTTISRAGLVSDQARVEALGAGGLSGAPVRERALEVTRLLRDRVGPDLTIVGVGGIATPADARARLAAGADLLQAYTAFIYGGATWPSRINRALREDPA